MRIGTHGLSWDAAEQVWYVRGKKLPKLIGTSAFKMGPLMSYFYMGRGGEWDPPADVIAARFIERYQKIFGRDEVVFRVFLETGDWSGHEMFGSPPVDLGFWNVKHLQNLCQKGERVKELTGLGKNILDSFFWMSARTGCVFEIVVDATLKHTEGLCKGVIDHAIREVCLQMRSLYAKYPDAAILVNVRNEADSHNKHGFSTSEINLMATRFYRWKRQSGPGQWEERVSYNSPGPEWSAEQWPEGLVIVDDGGRDSYRYRCGIAPGEYKGAVLHPERAPKDRKWWEFPDINALKSASRGGFYGMTEGMYLVSRPETNGWYRVDGWTNDLPHWLDFIQAWYGATPYTIIHTDVGIQVTWDDRMGFEAALAERFSGSAPAPGPSPQPPAPTPQPPPDREWWPAIDRVVQRAYSDVLGRPSDAGGHVHYARLLRDGKMTEDQMRRDMMFSKEAKEQK